MVAGLSVGAFVCVAGSGRGLGQLELDNEDGTWSVGFRDGSEAELPAAALRRCEGGGVWPVAPVAGGARVVVDASEAKPEGWTRFVCFSDTHGLHESIPSKHIVEADVLLHGGDFTNTGEVEQVKSFSEWLNAYPAAHKVVIAGNHDVTFEPGYYERMWKRYHRTPEDCGAARQALLGGGSCIYLEDAESEVLGYRIYGSPWQLEFCDWAFNLPQGPIRRATWDKIPSEVDILLVHGPPYGFGDTCSHGERVGCPELLAAVLARRVPVTVSGHIHEGYGAVREGATLHVNASTCTLRYRPSNPPIIFDLPPARELREATRAAAAAAAAAAA